MEGVDEQISEKELLEETGRSAGKNHQTKHLPKERENTPSPSASEKHRLQFYFEAEAIEALDEMQRKTGLSSRVEVVRYGLRFFEWILDEFLEGSDVIVRKPNGEWQAVIMPFKRPAPEVQKKSG